MFPTSAEIGSMMRHLGGVRLESELRALRPELDNLIEVGSSGHVTIDLPATRSDRGPKVVVGRMADMHWLIAAGRPTTIDMSVWHRDTPQTIVCSASLAMYDAARSGVERSTPWQWDEADTGPIVRAADLLSSQGFSITGVAGSNRTVPDEFGDFRRPRTVPRDFGDALRIELEWGSATLAIKPGLGWVLDVCDHLVTRRRPLALQLNGREIQTYWVQTDDIEAVVAATVASLRGGKWHILEGHLDRTDVPFDAEPKDKASFIVNWWLSELGFPTTAISGAEVQVKMWSKAQAVSESDVKGAYADAAVCGRSLIAVTTSRFSRPASSWLSLARIPAFIVDSENLRLYAANVAAEAHIPTLI